MIKNILLLSLLSTVAACSQAPSKVTDANRVIANENEKRSVTLAIKSDCDYFLQTSKFFKGEMTKMGEMTALLDSKVRDYQEKNPTLDTTEAVDQVCQKAMDKL